MTTVSRGDRTPLTFMFKNVGPIKNAELELGDLTVIAGRNNTGKTYLVYTLYGFLKTWDYSLIRPVRFSRRRAAVGSPRATRYEVFEQLSDQVAEGGQAELPVDRSTLDRERAETISTLTQRFSEHGLASVFSSPPDKFQNASISVRLGAEDPWQAQAVESFEGPDGVPSIRYDGRTLSAVGDELGSKQTNPHALRRRLWRQYLRFLFPELPTDPFVLSAERFGISLFYRELDLRKSQIVDWLQNYGDSKSKDSDFPFLLLDETVSRYARPVKDNIDYTRSISDLRRQKSEVYEDGHFNDIRRLINGHYVVSSDAIEFRSSGPDGRRFTIPLHLASSSARGLSDFYFFLRHVARRNHMLIIDEPESHLDTGNQILLARLLARLVRAGLKIVLTTHSDYLIKELNNLIMLSSSFADKKRVVKRLRYAKEDGIAPERIRAYVAVESSIAKCRIDNFGIDMPNFDETIDAINNVASELAIRLAEEQQE